MSEEQNSPPPPSEDLLWGQLAGSIDFSALDRAGRTEYPPIPEGDAETDPLMARALDSSRDLYDQARAQKEGTRSREKEYHEQGWRIFINTPRGIVFLNSGWLGNFFELSYPKVKGHRLDGLTGDQLQRVYQAHLSHMDELSTDPGRTRENFEDATPSTKEVLLDLYGVDHLRKISEESGVPFFNPTEMVIPDEVIKSVLGVEEAREVNPAIADGYHYFHGADEEDGKKVWIENAPKSGGATPLYIDNQGNTRRFAEGGDDRGYIKTVKYDFGDGFTVHEITSDPEAIQKYRDRFIALASLTAFRMGGATSVTTEFNDGSVIVPEDLYREGYSKVEWLKGDIGDPPGMSTKRVRAKKGDRTVVLDGRVMIPWAPFLHVPTEKISSPQDLIKFIKDDLLHF